VSSQSDSSLVLPLVVLAPRTRHPSLKGDSNMRVHAIAFAILPEQADSNGPR